MLTHFVYILSFNINYVNFWYELGATFLRIIFKKYNGTQDTAVMATTLHTNDQLLINTISEIKKKGLCYYQGNERLFYVSFNLSWGYKLYILNPNLPKPAG